jgi:hypothetical protein
MTLEATPAAQTAADKSKVDSNGDRRITAPADLAPTPTAQAGSPFFADLVRAHYVWERALDRSDSVRTEQLDALEDEYEEKLSAFQAAEGEIVEAYWCIREASAVALTEEPQTLRDRWTGDRRIRLHRVSNWLMPRSAQTVSDVLHDCDELAIRAEEILRGTPKRIALRSMFKVESHVLAFLERTQEEPTKDEIDEFVKDARDGIKSAHECYQDAADKVARMVYVSGILAGLLALVPVAALTALTLLLFGALHLHSSQTRVFFACIAAGALGALVSVLSRMALPGKFELDPEVGRRTLFALGMYRPLVGSVFGLALYFLLSSSLLKVTPPTQFATFVVGAFLGGFSERFVRVMLHSGETSLGATGSAPKKGRPRSSDRARGEPSV